MSERKEKLYEIFKEYNIYPQDKFIKGTAIRVFEELYPDNHYTKDFKELLKKQETKPTQRGADLSWWGKKYFTNEKGKRVFMIFQDSESVDCGSIVFYSSLFPVINKNDKADKVSFKKFENKIDAG